MRVVALISGGKDSCFNMMECVRYGHEIVALANLCPPQQSIDELDSAMFQTVGHQIVGALAECLQLPLFQETTEGEARGTDLTYPQEGVEGDEVESLARLLARVKELKGVEGVSVGAIASSYQRLRVEAVSARLGLTVLSYLWQRPQHDLLVAMEEAQLEAVVIKVASYGLQPSMLGQTLRSLRPSLEQLHSSHGVSFCGEGGEYETLTVDCPLFRRRLCIDVAEVIVVSADEYAPVAFLKIQEYHLENKPQCTPLSLYPLPAFATPSIPPPVPWEGPPQNFRPLQLSKPVGALGSIIAFTPKLSPEETEVGATLLQALNEVKVALSGRLEEILLVWLWVADIRSFGVINEIYGKFFSINPPSRVCVALPLRGSSVIVEVLLRPSFPALTHTLHVQSLSNWAAASLGPYAQAKRWSSVVWLAGQIGLYPPLLQLVGTPNIPSDSFALLAMSQVEAQTKEALRNTVALLEAMNSHPSKCLACQVFLTHLEARSLAESLLSQTLGNKEGNTEGTFQWIEVTSLPRGAIIEIQVIALTTDVSSPITSHGTIPLGAWELHWDKWEGEDYQLCHCHVTGETQNLKVVLPSVLQHLRKLLGTFWEKLAFARFFYSPLLSTSSLSEALKESGTLLLFSIAANDFPALPLSFLPSKNLPPSQLFTGQLTSFRVPEEFTDSTQ